MITAVAMSANGGVVICIIIPLENQPVFVIFLRNTALHSTKSADFVGTPGCSSVKYSPVFALLVIHPKKTTVFLGNPGPCLAVKIPTNL